MKCVKGEGRRVKGKKTQPMPYTLPSLPFALH